MIKEKVVGNDHFASESTVFHIHYIFLNSSAIRRMPYNLSFRILLRVGEEIINNCAKKTGTMLRKLEYMVTLAIEKIS